MAPSFVVMCMAKFPILASVTEPNLDAIARAVLEREERSGRLAPSTGLALAVVRGGELSFRATFGHRDRARALPVTPRTVFDVGSLTKSMTAAALHRARVQGRLDLDEPLRARGLFEVPSEEATLADVLSHRTGMPGHDLLWYLGDLSARELARRVARLAPVPGAFRRAFVYNNALYGCTRLAIEHAYGRSFEQAIAGEVLEPLGMTSTTLGDAPEVDEPAEAYQRTQRMDRKIAPAVAPAGGARATLEDMTRWVQFQLGGGGELLPEDAMHAMTSPQISAEGMSPLLLGGLEWLGTPSYGQGWFIGRAWDERARFHMGLIDGFSSLLLLVPAKSLGVVVLMNDNMSAVPGALAEALCASLLGRAPSPPPADVAAPAPVEPAPEVSAPDGLEGSYEEDAYGRLDVRRVDGALSVVYGEHVWPLRFHRADEAAVTVRAFGLDVPLPVSFGPGAIAIPLSLDPRVPPQAFTRLARS